MGLITLLKESKKDSWGSIATETRDERGAALCRYLAHAHAPQHHSVLLSPSSSQIYGGQAQYKN